MNEEIFFDENALVRLRKLGGDEFVIRMLDLFLDYAPQRLAAARAAEQAGDLTALGKAVHPLKSSAGQIGARRVQELAAQIEKLATQQQAGEISTWLAQLEAALEHVKPRLAQARNPSAS